MMATRNIRPCHIRQQNRRLSRRAFAKTKIACRVWAEDEFSPKIIFPVPGIK